MTLRELQRFYYATPTSYLELIQTYKDLLGNKRKAVGTCVESEGREQNLSLVS